MSAKDQYTEQKYRKMIKSQKMEARILLGTKGLSASFELGTRCFLNLIHEAKKKTIISPKNQRIPKISPKLNVIFLAKEWGLDLINSPQLVKKIDFLFASY